MSVPEEDISLGHSAPATLQCSQKSNHDALVAELKSYKQDIVPQVSHRRSEVSTATNGLKLRLKTAPRRRRVILVLYATCPNQALETFSQELSLVVHRC